MTQNEYKIEDFFVSYEIAKGLKDLDFNYPCLGWWDDSFSINELMIERINPSQSINLLILAPTYDQVFTWFIQKYKLAGVASPVNVPVHGWCYDIYNVGKAGMFSLWDIRTTPFKDIRQAQEECIKEMIKIVKDET